MPQNNGICEWLFHKTILQEFHLVVFRKKIYDGIEALQIDLEEWIDHYNNYHTYQGKICEGRSPLQTMTRLNLVAAGRMSRRRASTRMQPLYAFKRKNEWRDRSPGWAMLQSPTRPHIAVPFRVLGRCSTLLVGLSGLARPMLYSSLLPRST